MRCEKQNGDKVKVSSDPLLCSVHALKQGDVRGFQSGSNSKHAAVTAQLESGVRAAAKNRHGKMFNALWHTLLQVNGHTPLAKSLSFMPSLL